MFFFQTNNWGKTKERLAELIEASVPDCQVTHINRHFDSSHYTDIASWSGYAKYIGGPYYGETFSFCSYDTMTECVKRGVEISYVLGSSKFDPQKPVPPCGLEISKK